MPVTIPCDGFLYYCNGTVTLEENIADLGGVNIALDAYTEHLTQQSCFGLPPEHSTYILYFYFYAVHEHKT